MALFLIINSEMAENVIEIESDLWETWRDPASGEDVLSATIIVSGASDWMTPCHNRMPVLLTPDLFDAWLSGAAGADVLRPAAEAALREWIVTTRLNPTRQGDEDASTIEAA